MGAKAMMVVFFDKEQNNYSENGRQGFAAWYDANLVSRGPWDRGTLYMK